MPLGAKDAYGHFTVYMQFDDDIQWSWKVNTYMLRQHDILAIGTSMVKELSKVNATRQQHIIVGCGWLQRVHPR